MDWKFPHKIFGKKIMMFTNKLVNIFEFYTKF